MEEGRVVDRIEVVRRQRKANVGDREGRRCPIEHRVRPADEGDQNVAERNRDQEHDRGRRQDSAHAPGVEPGEAYPPGLLALADEQPRDQETGHDEEQVYSDEAALDLNRSVGEQRRVKEDHQQHGDAAQALDVRPET